jgi:sec-independent protein translocase protein TatA
MPGNIGPLEIAVVLIIVLIIFGPKRLPELGRSIGRGIREFRHSIGGGGDKDEDEEKRRELETAQVSESTAEPESASAGAGVAPGTSTQPGSEQKAADDSVEGEVVSDKRV